MNVVNLLFFLLPAVAFVQNSFEQRMQALFQEQQQIEQQIKTIRIARQEFLSTAGLENKMREPILKVVKNYLILLEELKNDPTHTQKVAQVKKNVIKLTLIGTEAFGSRSPLPYLTFDPHTRASNGTFSAIPFLIDDQRMDKKLRNVLTTPPGRMSLQFGSQYMAFLVASGLIASYELAVHFEKNPMVLSDQINGASDLGGILAFGAFFATQHPIANSLHGVLTGRLSSSFVPYIGMAAGSLASSLFYELWTDMELRDCLKGVLSLAKRTDETARACQSAEQRWVASSLIDRYTPMILSLFPTLFIQAKARELIIKHSGQEGMQIVLKSLKIVHRSQVPQGHFGPNSFLLRRLLGLGTTLTPLGAGIVIIGDFAFFMVLDSVFHEHISNWWAEINRKNLNVKSVLDFYLFHPDYYSKFFSPSPAVAKGDSAEKVNEEFQKWTIRNPFDVDANTIASANRFWTQTWKMLYQTSYRKPEHPYFACIQSLNERITSVEQRLKKQNSKMTLARVKDSKAIECEILHSPLELIAQHAKVQKTWRQHLLKKVNFTLQQWQRYLANISVLFGAGDDVYSRIVSIRSALSLKNSYDSSFQITETNFRGLLSSPFLLNLDQNSLLLSHPKYVGAVPTNDLLTHIIVSAACGPNPNSGKSIVQSGWFAKIERLFSQKSDENQIKLGHLGPVEVQLPRILKKRPSFCDSPPRKLFDQEFAEVSLPGEVASIWDPTWSIEQKDRPTNLVTAVISHLTEDIYQAQSSTPEITNEIRLLEDNLFSVWWDENVLPIERQIQQELLASFSKFSNEVILKTLNKTEGAKNSPIYSEGIYESISEQTQNYLSKIHDLGVTLEFSEEAIRQIKNLSISMRNLSKIEKSVMKKNILDTVKLVQHEIARKLDLKSKTSSFDDVTSTIVQLLTYHSSGNTFPVELTLELLNQIETLSFEIDELSALVSFPTRVEQFTDIPYQQRRKIAPGVTGGE